MKKYLLPSLVLLLGVFLITGCSLGKDEIEEQADKDAKLETKFELKQVSDKELSITVQNGKKGTSKKGTIVLEGGEEITYSYSFHGMKEGVAYLIPKGKTKDEAYMSDSVIGEGQSTASELEAGEYEILFEVESDSLTGSMNVKVALPEVEEE